MERFIYPTGAGDSIVSLDPRTGETLQEVPTPSGTVPLMLSTGRGRDIAVIYESGIRGASAASLLQSAGLTRASNVIDGTAALSEAAPGTLKATKRRHDPRTVARSPHVRFGRFRDRDIPR